MSWLAVRPLSSSTQGRAEQIAADSLELHAVAAFGSPSGVQAHPERRHRQRRPRRGLLRRDQSRSATAATAATAAWSCASTAVSAPASASARATTAHRRAPRRRRRMRACRCTNSPEVAAESLACHEHAGVKRIHRGEAVALFRRPPQRVRGLCLARRSVVGRRRPWRACGRGHIAVREAGRVQRLQCLGRARDDLTRLGPARPAARERRERHAGKGRGRHEEPRARGAGR